MTRPFSSATAEQVIVAVEAVVVNRQPTSVEFVADFLDVPKDQAEAALLLAADLGFLSENTGKFSVASPLCRFIVTANQMQKAAVLRVMLESYEPFIIFRERLVATGLAATVGQQTKVALDLAAHREGIKDTLISLGTYNHTLVTEGGGRYRPEETLSENPLETLAQACSNATAAEGRIREQLGPDAAALVSREEVIIPLADAFLRAKAGDSRGAVVAGGNAVESYLDALASRVGADLSGATGINAKLDRLSQGKKLPKKLGQVGKYLGHVRNAADHGVDPDVGASWAIRDATGLEYVYVACSFMAATTANERGKPPEI
jgi:hypothetical protein